MVRALHVVLVLCLAASIPGEALAAGLKLVRTTESYEIPDVTLVNQDGERVGLKKLLESDEVVLVDFIYATCTTICPVLSAGFANFQKKLATESPSPWLVSISIDPDHDIPEVMKEYLRRYRAQPGWDFLSGSRADVDRALTSMNAYVENKMAHFPLVLLRSPATGTWTRLNGFVGTSDLIAEYRKATGK